jgi:hypothetical protein
MTDHTHKAIDMTQGLSRMTFLSACFLAGWFPQARDSRWLSSARRSTHQSLI